MKVVDPSFYNLPALPVAGTLVPDFPLGNKSFNLSTQAKTSLRTPGQPRHMLKSLPEEPGEAAITVTQHYLAGGLSLLLAQLQRAADPASGSAFEELRREAETAPVAVLGSVAARALRLGDTVCWESVSRGDSAAFRRQAAAAAELYEFGLCAGLLDEE